MSWKVERVMTPRENVVVAYADTPFKQIAERLHMRDVSALPVVDNEDRVLGVVSEADLLVKESRVRARGRDRERAAAVLAGELMTAPAVTISRRAEVAEAARVMHERRIKRLPVVDEAGRLLGIVSRRDLLTVFLRADREIEEEVLRDLRAYLWLAPPGVTIAVSEGLVTLRGEVETRSLAELAGRLAAGVEGVTAVVNDLVFKLDDHHLGTPTPPLALQLAAADRANL